MARREFMAGAVATAASGRIVSLLVRDKNVRIRLVCAIAVLCCSLAAEATRISNLDAKGYPVIVPTVKKLTPAPGTFAIKGDDKAVLASVREELTEKGVPDSKEGYVLTVSPRGIAIRARTAVGLFYGKKSVEWMLRNRAGDALKCCTIEDWPDLRLRGAFLELNNLKSEKMPRQIEALDGLAALKYNAVLCDFGANLPFSIADEFNRAKLTKEDVAAFVAAAKRNNIAIIPKFQVLSHALWLTYHRDWNAIKEGDPSSNWNSGYCPQNAEAQRILETVVRETCDMFEPKFFHLGLDEQKGCPHQVCEKCKGRKWADLVVGHVKPLVDLLLARGIRPIVYHDEFMNANPLRGYKDLVEVPERLGPKTIINYWLYDANPISAQYDEGLARGHKGIFMSWHVNLDNVMNLPKLAHKVGSPGCILAWWLGIQPTMEGPGSPEASAAAVLQSVYSWNASAPVYDLLPFDPQLAFVQAFPYVHTRARFASQPTPVPLGSAAAALVGGGNSRYPKLDANVIRRLAKDVAPDGFRLETAKGGSRLRAAVLSGSKDDTSLPSSVVLPFRGRAEGFSVLTTLAPFSTFALGRGTPLVCRLAVRYADGQEGRFDLCLRKSIAPWNAATGGLGMRFVSRVNDADGLSLSLGAAEWRNPRPEAEIVSLSFNSAQERDAQPVLLALTAYGAKDLVPPPKGPDRPLVDLVPVEGAPFTPLYDFAKNPDLKGLSVYCNRGQKGVKLERRIVDGPGDSRALEVVVPKDPDPVSHRFTIKFPLAPTQEFATVHYDFYCDHPEAISRADMYVHGPGWDSAIGFATFSAPGWNHLSLPRTMMSGKESGGATLGKYRDLNISFFMTPGETTTLRFTAPEVSSSKEACRIDRRAKVE